MKDRRRGLGFDFLDFVEAAVKSILEHPKTYRVVYSSFRCCVVRRFPFSVFYTIEGADVIVHAVFDNRQDAIWRHWRQKASG